jgi:hypothetical protein
VQVSAPDDLPDEVRAYVPGEVFEKSKDDKIDLIISLPNDNAGLGLWWVVTGHETGDDFGDTHGVLMQVGQNVNDLYMQGNYETNLYTHRASPWGKDKGQWHADQLFTEENIIRFVVDNQNKGNVTFWQAGIGIIELNSRDVGNWLFASGQQKGYHKLAGTWSMTDLADGQGIRSGAFVEGSVGAVIANHIFSGGKLRLKATGQLTGVLGSLDDTSSVTAAVTTEGFYQPSSRSLAYTLNFGVETMEHQTANSPSTTLSGGAGLAGQSMGIKLVVRQTVAGVRQNYVNYNLDRGRTYTLQFFKKFGVRRGEAESITIGTFRR